MAKADYSRRVIRRIAALLSPTAILVGLSFLLTGCRLYEPPRYTRLVVPAGDPSLRVLLIGNSLTYYNDLPGLLQQFSAHEPNPIQFAAVTWPYASLKFHWDMGNAQKRIRDGHWDYVILQDFSNEPATDPEKSIKYFELFNAEVRKAGAKTIVTQNWTHHGHEKDYDPMLNTYQIVIQDTHATLAPIGQVWRSCVQDHPEIKLFVDDRHPSDAGTYLAACVLYSTLYHKNPENLPMDLMGPKIPASEMTALRHLAAVATTAQSP